MKKINNKGLTLLELIVSFAIVGVAIIYFYQTLNTVSKLYSKARTQTDEFANTSYVLRLVDAKLDKIKEVNTLSSNDLNEFCKKIGAEGCSVGNSTNGFGVIEVEYNNKKYKIYKSDLPEEIGTDPGSSGGTGTDPGSSGGTGTDPGSSGGTGTDPGSSGETGTDPGSSGETGTNPGSSGGTGTGGTVTKTRKKVGTATETWEVKATSVELSKAGKSDHGVTYNEKDAVKKGTLTYDTPGIDCSDPNSGCEKSTSAKKSINYERRNFTDFTEIRNITLSKVSKKWRVFKPCSSYKKYNTKDVSKAYYGYYNATGCDAYGDTVDATGLKKGMYIASVATGSWTGQGSFKCQGVLPGVNDVICSGDVPGENTGSSISRNLDVSWLTATGNNHRYNSKNKSYEGVSYVWKLLETPVPMGINWNLALATYSFEVEEHRATADTYVIITYTYDVYAMQ